MVSSKSRASFFGTPKLKASFSGVEINAVLTAGLPIRSICCNPSRDDSFLRLRLPRKVAAQTASLVEPAGSSMLIGNSTTIALMFLPRKESTPVNRLKCGTAGFVVWLLKSAMKRLNPIRSKKNGSSRGPAKIEIGPIAVTTGGFGVAALLPSVTSPSMTTPCGKVASYVWQGGCGAGHESLLPYGENVKSILAVAMPFLIACGVVLKLNR